MSCPYCAEGEVCQLCEPHAFNFGALVAGAQRQKAGHTQSWDDVVRSMDPDDRIHLQQLLNRYFQRLEYRSCPVGFLLNKLSDSS